MSKQLLGALVTSITLLTAGCGSDAGDGQGEVGLPGSPDTETTSVCAWEATPGAPVLTLTGTTPLEEGDVAVVFRSGSHMAGRNEGCAEGLPFVGARAHITPQAGGGGSFTLAVPSPPAAAFEVAELWGDEYAKGGPRVVPVSLVALLPGVGDTLDEADISSQVAYVARTMLTYYDSGVPANEDWFAAHLYGPGSVGYHAFETSLEFDPLNYCGSSQCLCWYGDTGYGYCGPEVRTPTSMGQPIAVDAKPDGLLIF